MAKLTYAANISLDGYLEDAEGRFDWSEPDAEVHQFWNDVERAVGISLYGRRMYETMAVWETLGDEPGSSPIETDYAEVWRSHEKIVYSRTLDAVSAPRTRLEREFDPEAVRRMKETADLGLSIGGPDLAQHAFRAGLVDEVQLVVYPVVVGGGKPALPPDLRLELELLDEHRFETGAVHLHYRL